MLNMLIKVASGLTQIGVLIFIGIGAVMGGIAGFCVAAIIFGIVAAIFDMQNSLRILADASRRATRLEAAQVPVLGRKEPPPLR